MNTCKECGSKKFVLNFINYDGKEINKDYYCMNCVLSTMTNLFADDTEEIIKDFFEARRLEDTADLKRSEIAHKIKKILVRDHMTLDEAKEFVFGVSYKAPKDDDGEEKSEDK